MTADARPPSDDPGAEPRTLAVQPVRLLDPGGGRRSAGLALLVLVAVLAGAVGLTWFGADRMPPTATSGPSGAAAVATSAPPTTPLETPSATLVLPSEVFNAHELGQVVEAGELEGRLVLIKGNLESIPLACDRVPTAFHTCVLLAIEGVDLPVQADAVTLPWHDEPAPGDYLVVLVRRGTLFYLGSIAASPYEPVSIGQLTRHLLARKLDEPPRTLFATIGWLVVNPVHTCYRRDPGATPCPTPAPFLAADQPTADGLLRSPRGQDVTIAGSAGIDTSSQVVPGSFLVTLPPASECRPGAMAAGCAEGTIRWVVVARYDPATAVYAHVP